MRPSTIRYFLKEGFSGLKKNLLMTVASIIAVAACISIMSFSYCVVSNLQYMLDQMEDSIGISVFLKGDLTSEDIENMKTTISGLDHVTNVTYISPADALDQLKEQWGADEDIFIGLDDTNNPLSHSFQVELDQIESQDAVLAELQKAVFVCHTCCIWLDLIDNSVAFKGFRNISHIRSSHVFSIYLISRECIVKLYGINVSCFAVGSYSKLIKLPGHTRNSRFSVFARKINRICTISRSD